jgi:predicted HAD superfamily Cof-like phosphohydrolase
VFNRVFEFNQIIQQVPSRKPEPLTGKEKDWLLTCLKEEADEFEIALDRVQQVDALIDSMIFAAGGLFRMGLTARQAEDCLNAVMDANFLKKTGQKEGRVFEGVVDATKPEGWTGPELRISQILGEPL